MSEDKLVQAHGSFATATCLRCKKRYSAEDIRPEIEKSAVVRCQEASCKGQKNALVKPDITFYGEALPERFHQLCERDMRQAGALVLTGFGAVVD